MANTLREKRCARRLDELEIYSKIDQEIEIIAEGLEHEDQPDEIQLQISGLLRARLFVSQVFKSGIGN